MIGLLCSVGCFHAFGQGIFSCVDSKGRRLTADRPIAECLDREQNELNPNATVRRKLGPSLTGDERTAEEEKNRKIAQERSVAIETKRRERAMLNRYPNQASHDKERHAAIVVVDEVIATTTQRSGELASQRVALENEAEFFKSAPSKTPARLKRMIEEHEQHQAAQTRFVADLAGEKQRVNNRFDVELAQLRRLWSLQVAPVVPVTASAPSPVAKK